MKSCKKVAFKYYCKNSLIISDKNSKLKIIKSARNIPNLKIIDQTGANVYDILKYKNIILIHQIMLAKYIKVINFY